MKAKVNDYPAGAIIAFGGFEFVRYEYRMVPPGFENQAIAHPFLMVEAEPSPPPLPKPKAKKAAPRRRRRKATPKGTK